MTNDPVEDVRFYTRCVKECVVRLFLRTRKRWTPVVVRYSSLVVDHGTEDLRWRLMTRKASVERRIGERLLDRGELEFPLRARIMGSHDMGVHEIDKDVSVFEHELVCENERLGAVVFRCRGGCIAALFDTHEAARLGMYRGRTVTVAEDTWLIDAFLARPIRRVAVCVDRRHVR